MTYKEETKETKTKIWVFPSTCPVSECPGHKLGPRDFPSGLLSIYASHGNSSYHVVFPFDCRISSYIMSPMVIENIDPSLRPDRLISLKLRTINNAEVLKALFSYLAILHHHQDTNLPSWQKPFSKLTVANSSSLQSDAFSTIDQLCVLEILEIQNCENIDDHICRWIRPLIWKKLKKIEISNTRYLTSLKRLVIEDVSRKTRYRQEKEDQDVINKSDKGGNETFFQLESLNVNRCAGLTVKAMQELTSSSNVFCKSLRALDLSSCVALFPPRRAQFAFSELQLSFLSSFTELTSLNLSFCSLLDDDNTLQYLQSLHHLTDLDISYTAAACHVLSSLTSLRKLNLQHCKFTTLTLINILNANGNMEVLKCGKTNLSDGVMVEMCNLSSAGVLHLKELHLQQCSGLGLVSMEAAINCIPFLQSLQLLDLYGCDYLDPKYVRLLVQKASVVNSSLRIETPWN